MPKSTPLLPDQPPPAGPNGGNGSRVWLLALALVLAGVAVYSNTLSVPFLLDDRLNVLENPSIRTMWPPWAPFIPASETGISGRPVAHFTFALNWAISGDDPWSWHALNLIIHVLGGLFLFGALRRLILLSPSFSPWKTHALGLAFFAALLWTVHPLATQAVTYVTQRIESLASLFYLAAVYCSLRGWEGEKTGPWHVLAVLAFLGGVGSKEIIVTAPFMIFLLDWVYVHGQPGLCLKRSPVLYGGFGLGLVVLAAMVAGGGTSDQALAASGSYTPLQYLANQPSVICRYLFLSVWPQNLCFDYGWPTDGLFGWPWPDPGAVALCTAVLTCVLFLGIRSLFRRRAFGLAVAWFFGILAPTSSVMPLWCVAAEQRMYLPLAAVAVALVLTGRYAIGWWAQKKSDPEKWESRGLAAGLALLCISAASLGLATYARNGDYRSEINIWADTVEKLPDNSRALTSLGAFLFLQGNHEQGLTHLEKAIRVNPELAQARINMGGALVELGRPQDAVEHFIQAVRLSPKKAKAYLGLGNAFMALGQTSEAAAAFQKAVEVQPNLGSARASCGAALVKMGKHDLARPHLSEAARLLPGDAVVQNSLGAVARGRGDRQGAVEHFTRAVALDPDLAEARLNLGMAQMAAGRPDQALAHLESGVLSMPENVQARQELALAYLRLGRMEQAERNAAKAVELAPEDASARMVLGATLARAGKAGQARAQLEKAVEICPDCARAHMNLGLILAGQGNFPAAGERFRKALALDPEYAEAHANLGAVLVRQNQGMQALSHFQKALAIDPGQPLARKYMEAIQAKQPRQNP